MQNEQIEGWGADADPINRPGVPMETKPEPVMGSQTPIESQHSDYPVLMHGGRHKLPPVYGTASPPKALSGLIRRAAYKYPDHWTRHWMMLLMADRVDSWEHNLRRALPLAAVVLAGGLTYKLIRR